MDLLEQPQPHQRAAPNAAVSASAVTAAREGAAVSSAASSSSALVETSRFFTSRDAMLFGGEVVCSGRDARSACTPGGPAASSPSALQALADAQATLRHEFATRPHIAFRRRQMAPARALTPQPSSATSASPTVEVPLLPTAYLARRDTLPGGPDVAAERLHDAIQRSALLQSAEKTHFRCLRCFHVFQARPSVALLRPGGTAETSWEKESAKQDLKDATALSRRGKRPSYRPTHEAPAFFPGGGKGGGRSSSPHWGRGKHHAAAEPTCCPLCKSHTCQWLMEYAHRKTVMHATRHTQHVPILPGDMG
jgi:hypothetical protein